MSALTAINTLNGSKIVLVSIRAKRDSITLGRNGWVGRMTVNELSRKIRVLPADIAAFITVSEVN